MYQYMLALLQILIIYTYIKVQVHNIYYLFLSTFINRLLSIVYHTFVE